MAIDNIKFNIFSKSPAVQSFGQTQTIGHNPASGGSSSGKGFFAGNTYGINENIKTGDTIFIAAQSGKPAGIGHSQWIA